MESKTIHNIKLIESEPNLCDHCLGRAFSKLIEGEGNKHRGEIIRESLNKEDLKQGSCYICNNLFDNLDYMVGRITEKINHIEFSTFLVGSRLPSEVLEREKILHEKLGLDVENIKKEINREIGKELYTRLEKEVDFSNPNIVIMANFISGDVDVQINPIFIEGRYRKFIRGIPQTKWPCNECKGKGCLQCDYTGQMYPQSVELLVSPKALEEALGSDSKFHGAGREDIDVRMLGNGRPFVLEIKEPHKRNFDLELLTQKINEFANGKVEVSDLKFTTKERKANIKCTSTDTYKVYRALVELEEDIEEKELDLLQSLDVIKQRTPIRVSHRRADKIRIRKVRNVSCRYINSRSFEMMVECEGGLYIKELISGDDGRSNPSVSQILKNPAFCAQLDVLEVNI